MLVFSRFPLSLYKRLGAVYQKNAALTPIALLINYSAQNLGLFILHTSLALIEHLIDTLIQ